MELLRSTIWNLSLLSYVVLALGIVGAVIWWIVRRKRERVWFPILRIFSQSRRQLPSLRLRPPPWLAFLCFLGLVCTLVLLSAEPKLKIFTPRSQKFNRQHLFIDLSPSVSAYTSITSLREMVSEIFVKATKDGQSKFSLSFSDRDDIYYVSQLEELSTHLQGIDFHRFGAKIGHSLESQIRNLGQVDVIYIFSDADSFSWEGFNWRYLADKSDLRFMDVRDGRSLPKNIFVSFARSSQSSDARSYDWNVEISRRDRKGVDSGQLALMIGTQIANQIDWQIGDGQQSTDVNISLPTADVNLLIAKADPKEIVWRVLPADAKRDSIAHDNDFRQFAELNQHNILIIAEPGGERFIEDPTYHLQLALETQGMNVRRVDSLKNADVLNGFDFVMSYGGGASPLLNYCPLPLLEKRTNLSVRRRVWLMPFQLDADYVSLCQCYSLLSGQYNKNNLRHCEHVTGPKEWAEFPRSLGAKRVGGSIGEDHSMAWNNLNEEVNLEVMTFSIPLQPSRQTGLWHAKLPILLKSLMSWQGDDKGRSQTWPRLSDNVGMTSQENPNMVLSNVPLGESLGKTMAPGSLPTTFGVANTMHLPEQATAQERLEDAVPWIKICAWLACLFCLIEVLFLFWRRYSHWSRIRVDAVIFLAFSLFLMERTGLANVQITTLGFSTSANYDRLAKDVGLRTSLQLSPEPLAISDKMGSFSEPWLWTQGNQIFSDAKKVSEVSIWIRRGGFLVIQGIHSDTQLKTLTKYFEREGKWQTIPADHEIMRSFYLLKSLPGCQGVNWQGFHVDGRLAMISIPYNLLGLLQEPSQNTNCGPAVNSYEDSVRIFVNILMVALATDYKKDQIHLPEILKRLR